MNKRLPLPAGDGRLAEIYLNPRDPLEKRANPIKSLWTAVTTIVYSLIIIPSLIISAPFSRKGRFLFYFGKTWSWLIMKTNGVKIHVEGLENLIKEKSYIFISNHTSNLDPPAVALSVGHVVRFVTKSSLRKVPLFGTACRLARMIFIDRDDATGAIGSLNAAIKDLRHGVSACFFAEGTRTDGGVLGRFKKGGVMLALKSGLPVVPVTVVDGWRLMARKSVGIRSGTLRVIIGKPIEVLGFTEADRDHLTEKVRSVIEENLLRLERPVVRLGADAR